MDIVVAGGSGYLGGALVRRFRAQGHRVLVLTRQPSQPDHLGWPSQPASPEWHAAIGRATAVVNLAGEPLAGARWTAARKARIRDSRVVATTLLARAVAAAPHPPVFISGSAIGVYGPRGDEPLTEESTPGSDFLAGVTLDWERAALEAAAATRVVLLRTGVVLSREGGALPQLALPFRLFVGGRIGSGAQYVSWVHRDDWVALVEWALAASAVSGPINATAPHPVTNAELAVALGRALRRPAFVPAPAFAVRLAVGEMADAALLNGQRVLPAKAQALGFRFTYPRIDAALAAIYATGQPT
jgi:uncharacterized protein (TIGR01777 family)